MSARAPLSLLLWLAALAALAPAAGADFGLSEPQVSFTDRDGNEQTAAGSHPHEQSISFAVNTNAGGDAVQGAIRDLVVTAPEGLVGDRDAVPRCETIDFLTNANGLSGCADSTAVGLLEVTFGSGLGIKASGAVPVYNLDPAPGAAAKLGFTIEEVPIAVELGVQPSFPYNIRGTLRNTSQVLEVFDSHLHLWGVPADPDHDTLRGHCVSPLDGSSTGSCPSSEQPRPFLTLPRSCGTPLRTLFEATSWWSGEDPDHPGPPSSDSAEVLTPAMAECAALGFDASLSARPTTDAAEAPSGMDIELSVGDDGIGDAGGVAGSDIARAEIAFPEGVTANPSLAEGLVGCSPDQLAQEAPDSGPDEGCPQASKIGTLAAETPILRGEVLRGELFLATPDDPAAPGAENPFDTLLALYMVIRDRDLGIVMKIPGRVEPDPASGRLTAVFDELPPYPVSSFSAHLREGGRSPLITPRECGTYSTVATLTPSGDPDRPLVQTSTFEISRGVDGGRCPSGPRPFEPGFDAGTVSNAAGSYSPFLIRLTRRDGDQDLTRFDATLPPGLLARLAGVERCPDDAIEAARGRSGRAELAAPSCPPGSQIGTVAGGAGVGAQLTYVPGALYLAGPTRGAPLSVVAIVPAVAGPFDVGTVVVRQALRVNPRSGVGSVDGDASDAIPHILAGIPLRVRDIRVNVDRPDFTLNPTSCDPSQTAAQIWGGGSDLLSPADDSPVARSMRFQAAACGRLGFRPRIAILLRGGARRGAHPALRGVYRPRPHRANLSRMVVRLPRSAFLEQAHIRTICTRVQFAADACPRGAIYGRATAYTPLLEEPLEGPVYLRSSNHELPDLVLALKGLVDIEASARIDSVRGGIRASFSGVPDAPLSRVVLRMRGAGKGLIVNSRNLCAHPDRAAIRAVAHNATRRVLHPLVRSNACKKQRAKRRAHRRQNFVTAVAGGVPAAE